MNPESMILKYGNIKIDSYWEFIMFRLKIYFKALKSQRLLFNIIF